MKKLRQLVLWLVVLLAFTASAQLPFSGLAMSAARYTNNASGGGGGGSVAFSDNFARANGNTWGSNWAVDAGAIEIISEKGAGTSIDYTRFSARFITNTATVNQYVMVTITNASTSPGSYPNIYLRMGGSNSPCYGLEFAANEDLLTWYSLTNPADAGPTEITSTALTIVAGDVFGVTITGTGTSTVIRVWRGSTGLPSAADNWNGDTTPDVSFTIDPSPAVDTGTMVGLGGQENTTEAVAFDNFYGGDIP